ncbi:hypothetical protein [Sorangium sp. So ce145]|uniref:hypothetical protein n=1 Tax=Sorangium sp. So ce145 TaxID=3133285 RepID=UPI003F617C1F
MVPASQAERPRRSGGACPITHEAEDLSTGGRIAVKQLLIWKRAEWKALDLFEREARGLANLTHPSIPGAQEALAALDRPAR